MERRRLHLSWLFLIGGAMLGAELSRQGVVTVPPILVILGCAYCAWSLYWGTPVVWTWWRHRVPKLRRFVDRFMDRPIWMIAVLTLLIVSTVYYSLFGGGIYQFSKAWRSHRIHP